MIERPSISMEPLPRSLLKAVVTASRDAPTSDAHWAWVSSRRSSMPARVATPKPVGELVQARPQPVLDAHLAHQGDGLAQRRHAVGEHLGEVAAEARVAGDEALDARPERGETAESSSALTLAAGAAPSVE